MLCIRLELSLTRASNLIGTLRKSIQVELSFVALRTQVNRK